MPCFIIFCIIICVNRVADCADLGRQALANQINIVPVRIDQRQLDRPDTRNGNRLGRHHIRNRADPVAVSGFLRFGPLPAVIICRNRHIQAGRRGDGFAGFHLRFGDCCRADLPGYRIDSGHARFGRQGNGRLGHGKAVRALRKGGLGAVRQHLRHRHARCGGNSQFHGTVCFAVGRAVIGGGILAQRNRCGGGGNAIGQLIPGIAGDRGSVRHVEIGIAHLHLGHSTAVDHNSRVCRLTFVGSNRGRTAVVDDRTSIEDHFAALIHANRTREPGIAVV